MRTCLKAITADVHTHIHVRIHTHMHLTIARDIILFGEHLVHIGFVKPVAGHERKTMSDVNLCAVAEYHYGLCTELSQLSQVNNSLDQQEKV